MALELGSHPKPTQIAEALVYVWGYPTGDLRRGWRGRLEAENVGGLVTL
jgi:hypothetical protein